MWTYFLCLLKSKSYICEKLTLISNENKQKYFLGVLPVFRFPFKSEIDFLDFLKISNCFELEKYETWSKKKFFIKSLLLKFRFLISLKKQEYVYEVQLMIFCPGIQCKKNHNILNSIEYPFEKILHFFCLLKMIYYLTILYLNSLTFVRLLAKTIRKKHLKLRKYITWLWTK